MNKIKKTANLIAIFAFMLLLTTMIYAPGTGNPTDTSNLVADIYNYNPNPVVSGETFELWIQLNNNSNSVANNIVYELTSKYPFTVVDANSNGTIPVLAAHATTIIKYKVRTDLQTINGTYNLEFKTGKDTQNIKTIFNYPIDVTGSSAIIDIVSSNIEDATVGGTSNIDLVIKNLGQKNAKDIFLTLGDSSDSFVKILNLKTIYLPTLNGGEEHTVSFQAGVSKDSINKSYTLPITITFKDSDGDHNITRSVGLAIKDNPNMVINVLSVGTSENNTLKVNADETISLEIYNTGNVDSEAVYVEIESTIIESTKSNFIGLIEKNNYDSVDLKFKTKTYDFGSLTSVTLPVNITVHYKDSNLKEQTITKTINVTLNDTNNGASSISTVIKTILTIIGLLVGLAILILILKWLNKVIFKPAIEVIKGVFKKGKK